MLSRIGREEKRLYQRTSVVEQKAKKSVKGITKNQEVIREKNALFGDKKALRKAIIQKEVLGKPKSLRG